MPQGQDLLTGSVPKKLIRFAFPLFLANLLQALYNVVDMLVVGKIVGKTGLAAISNASMLCFIINSLCIGLTMGGSVLVAQCKGANDQTGQRDTIGMLFFLSLVGSAVVTILGLAIYEALFQALNVPANAYQDACGYMKIICCGTVFVFGYNAVCSILKGLGGIPKRSLFRRCRHGPQCGAGCASGWAAFHGHGRRSLGHYHGSGCFLYGFPGISTAVSAGLFS